MPPPKSALRRARVLKFLKFIMILTDNFRNEIYTPHPHKVPIFFTKTLPLPVITFARCTRIRHDYRLKCFYFTCIFHQIPKSDYLVPSPTDNIDSSRLALLRFFYSLRTTNFVSTLRSLYYPFCVLLSLLRTYGCDPLTRIATLHYIRPYSSAAKYSLS